MNKKRKHNLVSIKEIYAIPATQEETETYSFERDFPDHNLNFFDMQHEQKPVRLVKKTHVSYCFDGERVWMLSSMWLDGKPFMLIQNAGRGGDDHQERFITNSELYDAAVVYLQSLVKSEPSYKHELYQEDYNDEEVTSFYGHHMEEFHDPTFVPKHKVGDIINIISDKKSPRGYFIDTPISVRVKILDVYPTCPYAPYRVVEMDRVMLWGLQPDDKKPVVMKKEVPDWKKQGYDEIYLLTDGEKRVDS